MLRKLPTIGLSLRTPHFFLGERWPIFYLLPQPHLAEKSPFVQGEALYCCWDLGLVVVEPLVRNTLKRSRYRARPL